MTYPVVEGHQPGSSDGNRVDLPGGLPVAKFYQLGSPPGVLNAVFSDRVGRGRNRVVSPGDLPGCAGLPTGPGWVQLGSRGGNQVDSPGDLPGWWCRVNLEPCPLMACSCVPFSYVASCGPF